MAQGSEFGFGKMYARGINDEALNPENDQFLHIDKTHNIAALLKTVGTKNDEMQIENGRFLCLRRANDISQDGSFVPAPQAGKHSDARFGTHHARDAHHIFETLDKDLNLFSSAIKLNTQYMHSLHFSITTGFDTTVEEVKEKLRANPRVAMTLKNRLTPCFHSVGSMDIMAES